MIRDFHAHIYFDPEQVEAARVLGNAAHQRFGSPKCGPYVRRGCLRRGALRRRGEKALQRAWRQRWLLGAGRHAEQGRDEDGAGDAHGA